MTATRPNLKAIRKRAEAATPGPWFWPYGNALAAGADGNPDGEWTLVAPIAALINEEMQAADQAFIAHAREDVPVLLEYIEALTGYRETRTKKLEAALRDVLSLLGDMWAFRSSAKRKRIAKARNLIKDGK